MKKNSNKFYSQFFRERGENTCNVSRVHTTVESNLFVE